MHSHTQKRHFQGREDLYREEEENGDARERKGGGSIN